MKSFYRLVLLNTFILAGCNTLGDKQSIKSPHLIEKDTTTRKEEVLVPSEVTLLNNKYLPLLDIVEQMRVFNEEQMSLILTHPALIEEEEESAKRAKERIQQNLASQSEFISEIYDQTLSLLNKKQDINQYLNFLLSFRKNYLLGRQICVEETLNFNSPKGTMTFPTSKNLFDFMMEDKQ